jgi:SAM-dependent methyltransferase
MIASLYRRLVSKSDKSQRHVGSAYYERLHAADNNYQTNNWLLSELEAILSIKPQSVLEVGCGNGRFLAEIKKNVPQAIGIDWARSPMLAKLGVAECFQPCDITKNELPRADLVCSADVLEHIAPDALMLTLERLDRAGAHQYHVIACYDDNHSHLSIMPPEHWLERFHRISSRYRLLETRVRFGRRNKRKPICVISTFRPTSESPREVGASGGAS